MKIVCDSCGAKYSIADEKVAGKVFKIRCKKCTSVIVVRGDQLGEAAEEEASTRVFDYGGEAVWHVVVDGNQQGPHPVSQIAKMLNDGDIDWDTYVWKEGFDNWKAARDVPEISAAAGGDEGGAAAGDAAAAAAAAAATAASDDADKTVAEESPAAAATADLFGGGAAAEAKPAAGGLFSSGPAEANPFAPVEPKAAEAAPAASAGADQLTGQRNENSVLFSLSNLQALATSTPGGAAPSSPSSPAASSPQPGFAAGEGSGLIDIRALAGSAATTGSAPRAPEKADDLLAIGGGGVGGLSGLGAPVLAPVAQEPEKKGSGMMVGLIAAAVAVLGLGGALVFVLTKEPEPVATAAPAAPVTATPAMPAVPAPGAGPAQPATPAEPAAAGGAPEAAEAAGGGSEASKSDSRSSGRSHSGSSRSGSSAPATGSSAPAPRATSSSSGKSSGGDRSIDDLLGKALGGSGGSKKPSGGGGGTPATPSRDDVLSAMKAVTGAVKSCGGGQHGTATVAITFRGSTGRVSNAQVSGQFAGSPVGSCVARAVRKAKVPPFTKDSFNVKYPFPL